MLSLFVVVFSTLLHDGNVTHTLKYKTMWLCSMYCRWLVLPVPGRIMEIHYTLTSFVQKGYQNSYSLLLIDFLKPSAKQATNVLLKCLLDSILPFYAEVMRAKWSSILYILGSLKIRKQEWQNENDPHWFRKNEISQGTNYYKHMNILLAHYS